MTYGEIKDVVREHCGRVGWPTFMLDQALDMARRNIENTGNLYWMRTSGTDTTVASTRNYTPVTDFGLTNFKDVRTLHAKRSTETLWTEIPIGIISLEEAFLAFKTDEEDFPELAVLDNATITLFPIPDAAYDMKLYAWTYTSNQSNLESDELSSRFPDALIYGALVWMAEQYQKAFAEADRWRALHELEIKKIHQHNFEREQMDKMTIFPARGPYAQRRLRLDKSIWL